MSTRSHAAPWPSARRILHLAMWITFVALSFNLVRQLTTQGTNNMQAGAVTHRPVRVVPYTVVLKETVLNAPGGPKAGSTQTFALRNDGGYLQWPEYLEPSAANKQTSQRIIQFTSGVRVQTDELALLRSSTVVRPFDLATTLRDPESNCLNTFGGQPAWPTQVLLGYESLGDIRAVRVSMGSQVVWFALQTGCARVRVQVFDGGSITNELTLTTLKKGEPDASLFVVHGRYKESPPSALYRRSPGSPEGRRMDAGYYASRCETCQGTIGMN